MHISKVRYAQLKNTGNYENIRVEAEADLVEGEDPRKALATVRKFVKGALGLRPSDEELNSARTLLEEWDAEGDEDLY